jgi:hypothetical protein
MPLVGQLRRNRNATIDVAVVDHDRVPILLDSSIINGVEEQQQAYYYYYGDDNLVREYRNLAAAIVWLLVVRELVRMRFQRR